MDSKIAVKFFERGIIAAKKMGFSQDAEDLSQSMILEWIKNGTTKGQTVDQGIIDALRRTFGRSSSPNYQLRRAITKNTESLDTVENRASNESNPGVTIDFEWIISQIQNRISRATLLLIYKWGFKQTEVGELFGFTESRVSQIIKREEETIQKKLLFEEQRKREPQQQEKISSQIQNRISRGKEKRILENLLSKKRKGLGKNKVQEISQDLLGTFRIHTF